MKKYREFIPIRITKPEAEKILHEKIDAYTWTVFNEFILKNCPKEVMLEKWWIYWRRKLNAA